MRIEETVSRGDLSFRNNFSETKLMTIHRFVFVKILNLNIFKNSGSL